MQTHSGTSQFGAISGAMDRILLANQQQLLKGIQDTLKEAEGLIALAPIDALHQRANSYTRHLIYSDPLGMYSAMLLVWHPGQHSPVHGHKTWCAYKVVQGTLTERHYVWDPDRECAHQSGQILRRAGDIVSAPAGLSAIHRLGNEGTDVAVSLHVYGVERDRISSHVNIVLDTLPAELNS